MKNEITLENAVEETIKWIGKFNLDIEVLKFRLAEKIDINEYIAVNILLIDMTSSYLHLILTSAMGNEEEFLKAQEQLKNDFEEFLNKAKENMMVAKERKSKNKQNAH